MVHFRKGENTQTGGGKTVADILAAAAEIVAKPGAWTQGTWARTADGRGNAQPGLACSWCLYGAIIEAGRDTATEDDTRDALGVVMGITGRHPIVWNDAPERTQAEVVAALREAARLSAQSTPSQVGTDGAS